MDAPNTPYKTGTVNPPREHLYYLERQQADLMTLSRQLNSYHCVPKTSKQYEQMEGIRKTLKLLLGENDALMKKIGESGRGTQQYHEDCQVQFRKMLQIEREVLTYIGRARMLA